MFRVLKGICAAGLLFSTFLTDTTSQLLKDPIQKAARPEYMYSKCKVVRLNQYSGNTIELYPAEFQLDAVTLRSISNASEYTNDFYNMKNGRLTYFEENKETSIFKTASLNPGITEEDVKDPEQDDAYGMFSLPLVFLQGVYSYTEHATPKGFVTAGVHNLEYIQDYYNGIHLDTVYGYVKSIPILGRFQIRKTIVPPDTDPGEATAELNHIGFTLYAAEDIINPDNGDIVVNKNEPAKTYQKVGDTYAYYDIGEKKCDESGLVTFENLPLGKYVLKESSTSQSLVENEKEYQISIEQTVFKNSISDPDVTADDFKVVIDGVEVVSNQGSTPYEIQNEYHDVQISVQDETENLMLDGIPVILKNADGTKIDEWVTGTYSHHVYGLKRGETYRIEQLAAKDGYYQGKTFEFTAEGKKGQHVIVLNQKIVVEIQKVDDDGNRVSGAQLKLTDVTDPADPEMIELPMNGITDQNVMLLKGNLKAGHRYQLEESRCEPGFYLASPIILAIPMTREENTVSISMIDVKTSVVIRKEDNHGNLIKGAKLSLLKGTVGSDGFIIPFTDENGNEQVIHTWITDGTETDISGYVHGSNQESDDIWYVIRENAAPFGFHPMSDYAFKVTGTDDMPQVVVCKDLRKNYYVSAVKVDAMDHKRLLKGAEITLFTKDGIPAVDVHGNKCIGLTDGKGVITWNVEYNDDLSGYYVQETDAPAGYRINPKKYEVELSEDFRFSEDHAYQIVVNDYAATSVVVNTSDQINYTGNVIVLAVSMTVLLIFLKIKRENRKVE